MIPSPQEYLKLQKYIPHRKETIIKCWHASVSISILISLLCGLICVVIANIEWTKYEFMTRGFKYVTFLLSVWVSAGQIVYFNIYSAIDIIDIYSERNPKLLTLKNHLHNAASYLLFMFVFPLSLLVTILFWTFYFWKREEMYPVIMDEVFPPLLNHVMHTFPAFVSIIYMFTSNRCEPPRTKTLAGLLAVITVYCACVLSIKLKDGKWVYLVIDSLTPLQLRCMFFFCIVGTVSFLFLGYLINDKVKALRKKLLD